MERYGRPQTAGGWHFLTGTQASIDRLTDAVGFRYEYDPKIGQFAHGAAIEVLTPKGTIAKYFYGIEFSPRDLRLGLIEASEEHIGTVIDDVLLFCYHYDPATGKYGASVLTLVRIARCSHDSGVRNFPDGQPAPRSGACRASQHRPGIAVPRAPNLTMFTEPSKAAVLPRPGVRAGGAGRRASTSSWWRSRRSSRC